MLRSLISETSSANLPLLHRCLVSLLTHSRAMSKSMYFPVHNDHIRDHGLDKYMEIEKKIRKVHKFQDLILTQRNSMICISQLDSYASRIGFKQYEAGEFILKFPRVFEVFEHPVQRLLYCRLTREVQQQVNQENEALLAQLPEAVTRLRKLIMLSNTGRLRLEHVRVARKEFGLPDDFESSVVLKYPQYFRLFDAEETRNKYIELVEKDPGLAVCSIESLREEEYRHRGSDAEDIRFSFIVNFPPGYRMKKGFRNVVREWQRLPYWSPYEDVSGYDLRSFEAQRRMEKTAVAVIHELLSLTVEKRITLEKIAHFRMAMNLPTKLKFFLLRFQGIFYISTKGHGGRLHTVFLRDAFWKGELIKPNDLYLARRRLSELVLRSSNRAEEKTELITYRSQALLDENRSAGRDYRDKEYGDHLAEDKFRQSRDTRESVKSDVYHSSGSDHTDSNNKYRGYVRE